MLAGGGLAFAQQDAHEVVKSIITSSVEDDERLVGRIHSGEASYDDSEYLSVRIDPAKSYLIYAACDFECYDIDVAIEDEDGFDIDSDYAGDDAAVISVEPNEAGDVLSIRIDMMGCYTDTCVWALGVYEQP